MGDDRTTPIYLDYNASTPLDPAVAAAMRPFLEDAFGNPSSGHWASTAAKAALERARGQVAALLDAAPDEVVFTGGGSEANNLALKGVFFALRGKGEHIITTGIEHPAALGPCRFLERRIEMSSVLRAMGLAPEVGAGAIRLSLGRQTTEDEIDTAAGRLASVLASAA